ncbi:hypothetical protein ACFX1X_000495 [Malus domestica]
MVRGLPQIEATNHVCKGYVLGKQARLLFPLGNAWRAKAPLQLVHTNICGPLDPMSYGDNRYFITFIGDFSRKTWVYFLKEKSDALRVFKEFKQGTRLQLTAAYTPQQNVIAERKNRTILDMTSIKKMTPQEV